MAPITVAAVQASSVSFDLAASLVKLESLVNEARQRGAQLVVFPEAFLSAYPRFLGFVIGTRTEENREWFTRHVNVGRHCSTLLAHILTSSLLSEFQMELLVYLLTQIFATRTVTLKPFTSSKV